MFAMFATLEEASRKAIEAGRSATGSGSSTATTENEMGLTFYWTSRDGTFECKVSPEIALAWIDKFGGTEGTQ